MAMKTDRLSTEQIAQIKKVMAFILRHRPFLYKIKLNKFGYAKISDITEVIKKTLKIENTLDEDVVIISRQFSSGIFEVRDGMVRARNGHTCIYNLNTPQGFSETKELPKELFCKIQTNDFVMDKENKLILSNKSYVMVVENPKLENGYTTLRVNPKKVISKNAKFYGNAKGEYFTPFIFSDSISIHVQ